MKRFGIVNYDVMTDPEVSLQAKGLYSLLCCYADKSRTCYPSISTLADISNKSTTQISVYIKEYSKFSIFKFSNGLAKT